MRKMIKKILIVCAVLAVIAAVLQPAHIVRADDYFSDVTDISASYYKPVYWAAANGIAKGYSDGTFRPANSCTRAQFVTFIWRMQGKPNPESMASGFSDIDASMSAFKAIQWAVEEGIIVGYNDGTFRPSEKLLRRHVATMLWRLAGKPEAAEGANNIFPDVNAQMSSYKPILWGSSTGIIRGTNGMFNPAEDCLRRQVVTFLYRYDRWLGNPHPDTSGLKKVYLTFDDGPYAYTDRLLDILAKYGAKATFFTTNQFPAYQDCVAREAAEGHAVAVHTYSHEWSDIYASDYAFWRDIDRQNDIIEAQTGKRATFFRFAGGSSNTISANYSYGIMSRLTDQAAGRQMTYYDWNVGSGDAGETQNSYEIYLNVINGMESVDVPVVLMHDIHKYTVDAIEDILEYGSSHGFVFVPLEKNTYVCHHPVLN